MTAHRQVAHTSVPLQCPLCEVVLCVNVQEQAARTSVALHLPRPGLQPCLQGIDLPKEACQG